MNMHSAGKYRCRPFIIVWFAGILLHLLMTAAASGALFPGEEKVRHATAIEKASRGESQDLIVVFDQSAAVQRALSLRSFLRADHDTPDILREKTLIFRNKKHEALKVLTTDDAETIEDYEHLPVIFLKVKSRKALERLAAQPGVAGIYENQHYSLFLNESLPLTGQPAVAAAGYTGAGTAVAVLDTGINYTISSAFGDCTGANTPGDCLSLPPASSGCRVACVHDFAADDKALDKNGHGTNVSGIVAGVAPDTKILGLDVFDGGGASFSVIAKAINWVIANKAAYNIVALNLSLGVQGFKYAAFCPGAFLNSVVSSAKDAGILSIVAAGNDGYINGISDPACVPDAVSVGAVYDANIGGISWPSVPCTDTVTSVDKVACFSNSSSFLSILAPGAMIDAAGITAAGTSQAAPHIAGAFAVLKSAFSAESADETVARMTSTGKPVLDARNNITKPRIDLIAAINVTFSLSGRVVSPRGFPMAGVTMTLSGASTATTVTDADGAYSFVDIGNGSYDITPSLTAVVFTPAVRTVTVTGSSVQVKNITANVYAISGKVRTASGRAVPGVIMTLGGDGSALAMTDGSGRYEFPILGNGTYTVTPSKTGYAFIRLSRTITVSGADEGGKHFTAVTHAIVGYVRNPSGAPMAGVTVSLSGDLVKTKQTDINGRFRFGNLPDGNYVVTPTKEGKIFDPVSRDVAISGENVMRQNFRRSP
jgi:subtilisin family serine protease